MAGYSEMADKKPVIGITIDLDGEYFKIKRYYSEAILKAGGLPLLLPVEKGMVNEIKALIDGLVISGGDDIPPEYYGERIEAENLRLTDRRRIEFELKMLGEFLDSKKPVLGICYGMQLINVFFGGSLHQDIKGHSDGFHKVEITDNRLIPSGKYHINSSHHQAIKKKGNSIVEIGVSTEDGIIEAITHRDLPGLFGLQWHPERMKDELSEKIFKNFVAIAGSVRYEDK